MNCGSSTCGDLSWTRWLHLWKKRVTRIHPTTTDSGEHKLQSTLDDSHESITDYGTRRLVHRVPCTYVSFHRFALTTLTLARFVGSPENRQISVVGFTHFLLMDKRKPPLIDSKETKNGGFTLFSGTPESHLGLLVINVRNARFGMCEQ